MIMKTQNGCFLKANPVEEPMNSNKEVDEPTEPAQTDYTNWDNWNLFANNFFG